MRYYHIFSAPLETGAGSHFRFLGTIRARSQRSAESVARITMAEGRRVFAALVL